MVTQIIKRLREEAGITQLELAEKLAIKGYKCSREYISLVEQGRNAPSRKLLCACEKVFGMEPGSLLMYSVLAFAERWCNEINLELCEFVRLINDAYRSVGPPQNSTNSQGDVEAETRSETTQAPPLEILTIREKRSIMSTIRLLTQPFCLPAMVGRYYL